MNTILVGALEDGVKFPQPEIADQRVELAEQAGFNALDVTTAWEPGQTSLIPESLSSGKSRGRSQSGTLDHVLRASAQLRSRHRRGAAELPSTFMATPAREYPPGAQLAVVERAEPERLRLTSSTRPETTSPRVTTRRCSREHTTS